MMERIDDVMQELWQVKEAEVQRFGSIAKYVEFLNAHSAANRESRHIAEPIAQRAGSAEKADLARLLLQVKAREPLAGDELL
jgi:predicted metalloprotease with PDZ domain